jgi:hypothetical protein
MAKENPPSPSVELIINQSFRVLSRYRGEETKLAQLIDIQETKSPIL